MAEKNIVQKLREGDLPDNVIDNIISRLKSEKTYYQPEQDRKLYDADHDILRREDKKAQKKDEDGVTRSVPIRTNKLVYDFHKKIVETALAFMFGGDPGLERDGEVNEELFMKFKNFWKGMKMDYKLEEIVRHCMIETKSAVLFYLVKSEEDEENIFKEFGQTKLKLKAKVLSYENGDEFFPHWDKNGSMDAFTRIYKVPDYDREDYNQPEPQAVEKTEIYTKDTIYHIIKRSTGTERKSYENRVGKIPVVYFDKKYPEWHGVETFITRLEWLTSYHSDTNDYFAFPALLVKGEVKNLPDKGEVGKMFQIEGVETENGEITYPGSVSTLTWDQSPASVENEKNELKNMIYYMTHTPDINFENLKGIGNTSGVALKLMFLDAQIKSKNNEKLFGDKIERVFSLLKEFILQIAKPSDAELRMMKVGYKFDSILPQSKTDLIDNLTTSVGDKPIMSQQTATEQHPDIDDPEEEMERIKKEESQVENLLGGGTFNP